MNIAFGNVVVVDPQTCAEIRLAFGNNASNSKGCLALRLRAKRLQQPTRREKILCWLGVAAGAKMTDDRKSMRGALQFFGRYIRMNKCVIHGL